jgi:Cu/Ag efflux pump CusA
MLASGYARVRPVLMTAAAMILGMVPMALGMGEGGEQNAPLGRAVIGGLLFATVTTLFVVRLYIPICARSLRLILSTDWTNGTGAGKPDETHRARRARSPR